MFQLFNYKSHTIFQWHGIQHKISECSVPSRSGGHLFPLISVKNENQFASAGFLTMLNTNQASLTVVFILYIMNGNQWIHISKIQ